MPDNGDWTVQTLKQYLEKIVSDRDIAVRLAYQELERRLEILNHAHSIAVQKERDFYSREQHDTFANQLRIDLNNLQEEISESAKPKWAIWISAALLFLGVITAQWAIIIRPYEEKLKMLEEADKGTQHLIEVDRDSHKNTMATINTRIDRLYDLYRDLNAEHQRMLQQHKK